MMKIATWNVNSLKVRLPHVIDWLGFHQPDALALQETKLIDDQFPVEALEQAGYQLAFAGQKTYNGVAILSRHPIKDTVINIPNFTDGQSRVLTATVGSLRIINCYVPNGQSVDSDKYHYKLTWLEHLTAFVKTQMQQHQHLVVVGDFNIAPEDRDVHDPEAWCGHVLVSPAERACFEKLLSLGLVDSFRLFPQAERSFSWWDYRAAAFRRNHGLRIDHILLSPALKTLCTSCIIDKEVRAWERPSDHAVVMAELDIQ